MATITGSIGDDTITTAVNSTGGAPATAGNDSITGVPISSAQAPTRSTAAPATTR